MTVVTNRMASTSVLACNSDAARTRSGSAILAGSAPAMIRLVALLLFLSPAGSLLAGEVYQTPEAFLQEVFDGNPPDAGVLWLKDEVRDTSTQIMGHAYPGLRIRYWFSAPRSAWILEETGKEKPISVGLVVKDNVLERLRVLEFRESRGWEVRFPFFTDQFNGVGLTGNKLDKAIDGISGATLSVRALEKLARLALYLHSRITPAHDTPAQK